MKFNNKIKVSIKEFFLYGKFDFIELGQSKEWILNNFPNPDDFGSGNTIQKAKVWRYGNLEFHFEKDRLNMIFSDYIDNLSIGNNLILEKWILKKPSKLFLKNVINKLNKQKMDFSICHIKTLNYVELFLHKSKVTLTFCPYENGCATFNNYILKAFCKK